MITVKSTINIANQSVPNVIPVVQGDTGRSILFSLADFTIPTGATARYFITKPSGLAVYNDATIDGNTVLVDLTAQSLAEYGDCPGQVRISVGDTVVTSFEFILHVEPFRGIDAVQSLVEMNIFDQMVTGAVDEAREQIEDAAEEVIETIPEDYTALTENVDGLNETIYNLAEAQGNPVIIYDGADNILVKDLKITFSASSNVNRIQVVRSGKNLVVDKLANGAVNGDGKYTNNSKRITNSFTSTYPTSRTWLKAGTYTLSVPGLSACTVVIKTNSTTVAHAWTLEQTLPFTFTTRTDGYFIFSARNSANTDISPSDYHAQLEAGAKATAYEPARVQKVTTILYPLTVSSGVLDFTTGQLTSGGSVYAVDAADISTVEGYNRIDAYMISSSTGYMASTTSMDVIYRRNVYAWDSLLNVIPTESAQGNPATFDDGADEIPVKDLKVSIVPNQDLHGYDKPWAGGAWKNKLPNFGSATSTENGITFTKQTDGSVNANGTATATATYRLINTSDAFVIPAGTYILTGGKNSNQSIGYKFVGEEIEYETGSGKTITLSASKTVDYIFVRIASGQALSNVVFYPMLRLSSESDATWMPYSNLCPITGMTEVEVERTGKNLLPKPDSGRVHNGVTWTLNDDGTVTANGTASGDSLFSYILPTESLDGNYYFLGCANGGTNSTYNVYMWDSTTGARPKMWDGTTNAPNSADLTTRQEVKVVSGHTMSLNCRVISGYTASNLTFKPMLIASTETDTSYAPYHTPQTVTTDLGHTVYGGTLDITTGDLAVTMVIVDLGALSWQKHGTLPTFWSSDITDFKLVTTIGNQTFCPVVCSVYQSQMVAPGSMSDGAVVLYRETGVGNRLFVKDVNRYNTMDATAFKAALTAENAKLVYVLATPQTYTLTPQELLSVLGTNHISTDAESVEVVYRADIALYIENLTEPDADMIADTNITSGSYFMVGNTLYLATANIANGSAIIVGTNCTRSNLASALNAINA